MSDTFYKLFGDRALASFIYYCTGHIKSLNKHVLNKCILDIKMRVCVCDTVRYK